jgi:hypothetical protein
LSPAQVSGEEPPPPIPPSGGVPSPGSPEGQLGRCPASEAPASFGSMDTFCICELCGEKVDPDDPGVVRAVEMIEVVTMARPTVGYPGSRCTSIVSTTRAVPPTTT